MANFLRFFKNLFFKSEISEADRAKIQKFKEHHKRVEDEQAAESLETENADKNESSAKIQRNAE